MPGTGPQCGGAQWGVIAMGRVGVIVALGALLGLFGGVVTAAPTVALADSARRHGGRRGRSVELKASRHDGWLKNF
jgi:hypothetical protein